MSELCQKLKFYIKKSHTNVYQISLNSRLDRTMLQKMVNGTKWPSVSFFIEFLDYLALNKKERDDLLRDFMIEKIGLQRYESRKAIDDLINRMKGLSECQYESLGECVSIKEIGEEVKNLYSAADMKKAFEYMATLEFKNSHPTFYLSELEDFDFLMKTIHDLEDATKKRALIYQYVGIRNGDEDAFNTVENIELLGKIMPWAYCFQDRYQVYYAYLSESEHNKRYRIYDRLIITGERILLISFDGSEGLLIQNRSIADANRHEFSKLMKISYRMFEYYSDFHKALQHIKEITNHRLLTLSYEAIPSAYYLAGTIDNDHLLTYRQRMSDLSEIHHFKMIIDPAYVIEFTKTGHLPENYAKDIPLLDHEEVQQALRSYLNEISRIDDVKFIKSNEKADGGVNIDLYAPNRVVFTFLDERMPFGLIVLEETGIYHTFMDYFTSLEEMGMADNKAAGLKKLQATVDLIIKTYDNDHK